MEWNSHEACVAKTYEIEVSSVVVENATSIFLELSEFARSKFNLLRSFLGHVGLQVIGVFVKVGVK